MKRWARNQQLLVGLVPISLAILAGALWPSHPTRVTNFDQCSAAGFPIQESQPEVCSAYGHSYVGPDDGSAVAAAAGGVVQTLPFEVMVEGDSRGNYPKGQEVIRTQSAWQSYWAAVHEAVSPLPPLLPVDFTKYDVIALSAGVVATNGYSLQIGGVNIKDGAAQIVAHETLPGISCVVKPVKTNPYYIVRVAKLPAKVTFQDDQKVHVCV